MWVKFKNPSQPISRPAVCSLAIQEKVKLMEEDLHLPPGEYRVVVIKLKTGAVVALYEDAAAIVCEPDYGCAKVEEPAVVQALRDLLIACDYEVADEYLYYA